VNSLPSRNTFEKHKDTIFINREGWERLGFATYREDYYDELTNVTWTKKKSSNSTNSYLFNTQLGLLHRYVMTKWYGEEMMREMDKRGWIVDHLNNDGMDCRISNLEFLAQNHNTAKGQTYDVESHKMITHLAVNIFKDFSTENYQITIGFNDSVYQIDPGTGKKKFINAIYLLYKADYRIVILDAERILLKYNTEHPFTLAGLSFVDCKVEYSLDVELTEEELHEIANNKRSMIIRDGKPLIVLGGGSNTKLLSVAYKEGWDIPQKDK
jgi:hypothetical protein